MGMKPVGFSSVAFALDKLLTKSVYFLFIKLQIIHIQPHAFSRVPPVPSGHPVTRQSVSLTAITACSNVNAP